MASSEPAKLIALALCEVKLPSLTRPVVGPNDTPTLDLVNWGIRSYAYSVVAHVRTILRGLMVLAEAGNQPTILIVGRHLYEWTMHASYMHQNLKAYKARGDINAAWELLLTTDTANGWIKRHGSKYWVPPIEDEVPDNVRIKHLVKAYKAHQTEAHGSESVEDEYGYLSEHAHANGVCFLEYRKISERDLQFVESSILHELRGVINAAAMDWLLCVYNLLGLGVEMTVRPRLASILKSLVEEE